MSTSEGVRPPPLPEPYKGPSRIRRLVLVGLIVVLVALWVYGMVAYINHRDPEFFSDEAFLAKANAACAKSQHLMNDREPPGPNATADERAASVERIAAIFRDLSRDLHGIPITSVDADAKERWLSELDRFIAVGPRYAAAIRSGDKDRMTRVGNQGDDSNHWFNATARENDMKDCVF